MNRLILFSGGVESTALLALKSPEDIVITIEDISPNNKTQTFNRTAIYEISRAMNVPVQFCQYSIPYAHQHIPHYGDPNWHHQLWTFLPLVSVYLTKNSLINEIWIGTSLDDETAEFRYRKKYPQLIAGWNILYPHVSITLPLSNLTTEQIWYIIPNTIKPLIRNCFNNTTNEIDKNCGICPKCIKLKKLPGSCLYQM